MFASTIVGGNSQGSVSNSIVSDGGSGSNGGIVIVAIAALPFMLYSVICDFVLYSAILDFATRITSAMWLHRRGVCSRFG